MVNLAIALFSFLMHPFYISVTEIKHDSSNRSIQINSKIFYDDLEKVLESQNHIKFDIVKPANKPLVNKLISDYVKKHLVIKADGKNVDYTFLKYQIEEDGAWCYFEATGIPSVKSLNVYDNLLYEEHEDQINILHVTLAGKRQTAQLNTNDTIADFPF